MSSDVNFGQNLLRIKKLCEFSEAIETGKHCHSRFLVLAKTDRLNLLQSLKLPLFDWKTVKAQGLKDRCQILVQNSIRKIFEYKPITTEPNPFVDLQISSLSSIIHAVLEKPSPSMVESISKTLKKPEKEAFIWILKNYNKYSKLGLFIGETSRSLAKGEKNQGLHDIPTEKTIATILFSRGIERVSIAKKQLKDQDLILFFRTLIASIPPDLRPNLDLFPTETEKSSFIRAWMNENKDALEIITQFNGIKIGIKSIPPEIKYLKNLRFLMLSNNAIGELPPELGYLDHLETLSLSRNQLHSISPILYTLNNLTTLSLSNNNITELPLEFGVLLSKLKSVNLSGNPIQLINEELLELKSLPKIGFNGLKVQLTPNKVLTRKPGSSNSE
jgi:hypothetical protein